MVDDKYVDIAFNAAKKYIVDYKDSGRFDSDNPNEKATIDDFHARINADDPTLRAAILSVITDLSRDAQSVKQNTGKREITYLAGALGAKDILLGLSNDTAQSSLEIGELRDLKKRSIQLDFSQFKKKLTEYSLESCEPYGKVRPIMHGIDMALHQIAEDNGLNIMRDNNLKSHTSVMENLTKEQESGKLNIFAVALTPEEAKKAAEKSGLSVIAGEAEETARNFNEAYKALVDNIKNLTLLDRSGKVLLKKRDGNILNIDEAGLGTWQKSFETEQGQSSSLHR